MDDREIKTLEQVREFVNGTADMEFAIETKRERYALDREYIRAVPILSRSRKDKGLLLRVAAKVSGYSRVHVKRLAVRYAKTGRVKMRRATGRGFKRKYTDRDIALLAETDELHETLSGPATKICERQFEVFGEKGYGRPAEISVAHLYNLRQSGKYRSERVHFTKTRPAKTSIGERRPPASRRTSGLYPGGHGPSGRSRCN